MISGRVPRIVISLSFSISDLLIERVRTLRVEALVGPHDRHQIVGVAEVRDAVGVARQHVDGLDPLAADLELQNLVRVQFPFADQAMPRHNDEEFPLAVVPVLPLSDARLRDVHGELPAILGFQQLREAAPGIDIHLERERNFLWRQVRKIGGRELLFKAALRNFRQQQGLRLGVKRSQQLDDFAQRYAVRHRHAAEILAGNRRQPVIITAVRLTGQGVQQLRHEVVDVDQLQLRRRVIDRDRQIICNVVAEGGHGGIVIRAAPLAEHIGEAVDQRLRAGFSGVGAQPLFAGPLCLAVFAARVAPDEGGLRGAGQHHGAAVARALQCSKQRLQRAGIAGEVFLRRFRAVHARQMEHEVRRSRIRGKPLR